MALKANSKQILDIIATQKEQNGAQAYREVHPNASDITARTNAYKLLQKPDAQIYLQQHIDNARSTIVNLLDSKKDDIRLRSAQDILDRSHGKARQVTEVNSQNISLNIDLTSSLEQ